MHPAREEDSFAFDVGSATEKEIPQVRCQVVAIRERIEREIDFAARGESPLKVPEKKIPFRRSPARVRRSITVKTNRKCSDPVELLLKVRERFEGLNSENRSRHAKNFEQFLEKGRFVNVETKNGMTEPFQDEQEKSTAAAEIKDAPGWRAVQFQILDSLTINAQPLIDIGIFLAGVPFLNFSEPILIEAVENRTKGQPKN